MEDAGVEGEEREAGGDAEQESSEVHARMYRARIADAGDEESGVRQQGESKPANDKQLRRDSAPAPAGRSQRNVGQPGAAEREHGACRRRIATRESYVGMEEKQKKHDDILEQNDERERNAVAGRRLAEKASVGKEQNRYQRIRKRSHPQRRANNMPARLLARRNDRIRAIG